MIDDNHSESEPIKGNLGETLYSPLLSLGRAIDWICLNSRY